MEGTAVTLVVAAAVMENMAHTVVPTTYSITANGNPGGRSRRPLVCTPAWCQDLQRRLETFGARGAMENVTGTFYKGRHPGCIESLAMLIQEERMTVQDPVCGMKFSKDESAAQTDYGDKTYYFCTEHCREVFVADPDRFVVGDGKSR
jgi:YHS domain-containing protein